MVSHGFPIMQASVLQVLPHALDSTHPAIDNGRMHHHLLPPLFLAKLEWFELNDN